MTELTEKENMVCIYFYIFVYNSVMFWRMAVYMEIHQITISEYEFLFQNYKAHKV